MSSAVGGMCIMRQSDWQTSEGSDHRSYFQCVTQQRVAMQRSSLLPLRIELRVQTHICSCEACASNPFQLD